jgi:hypothetical protein
MTVLAVFPQPVKPRPSGSPLRAFKRGEKSGLSLVPFAHRNTLQSLVGKGEPQMLRPAYTHRGTSAGRSLHSLGSAM